MSRNRTDNIIETVTLTAGAPSASGTINVKGCSSVSIIVFCSNAANFPTVAVASILNRASDVTGDTTLLNHGLGAIGTLTGVDTRKGRVMVIAPSQDATGAYLLTGEDIPTDHIKVTVTRGAADATGVSVWVNRNYHNHG